jgi:hypothetical protein
VPAAGNIGPDWPCNVCTWLLVLVPSVAFLSASWNSIDVGVWIALFVASLITLTILAMTGWSDPGYLPKQTAEQLLMDRKRLEEEGADLSMLSECPICNVLRPVGAQHCSICNACCYELDRECAGWVAGWLNECLTCRADHCPWHGKCIGKYNLLPFYTFLWAISLLIIFIAVCAFVWFSSPKTPWFP